MKKLAAKIAAAYESPNHHITHPTILRRAGWLECRYSNGTTQESYVFALEPGVGPWTITKWKERQIYWDVQRLTIKRIWVLISEGRVIERFENYHCARAAFDGREFHYAKWLMTKDIQP